MSFSISVEKLLRPIMLDFGYTMTSLEKKHAVFEKNDIEIEIQTGSYNDNIQVLCCIRKNNIHFSNSEVPFDTEILYKKMRSKEEWDELILSLIDYLKHRYIPLVKSLSNDMPLIDYEMYEMLANMISMDVDVFAKQYNLGDTTKFHCIQMLENVINEKRKIDLPYGQSFVNYLEFICQATIFIGEYIRKTNIGNAAWEWIWNITEKSKHTLLPEEAVKKSKKIAEIQRLLIQHNEEIDDKIRKQSINDRMYVLLTKANNVTQETNILWYVWQHWFLSDALPKRSISHTVSLLSPQCL